MEEPAAHPKVRDRHDQHEGRAPARRALRAVRHRVPVEQADEQLCIRREQRRLAILAADEAVPARAERDDRATHAARLDRLEQLRDGREYDGVFEGATAHPADHDGECRGRRGDHCEPLARLLF